MHYQGHYCFIVTPNNITL